jgi:hypothetical protein
MWYFTWILGVGLAAGRWNSCHMPLRMPKPADDRVDAPLP